MVSINRVRTVFLGVGGAPYYSNLYFTDDSTNVTAQAAVDATRDFWAAMKGNMTTAMTWTVEGTVARIDDVTGTLLGQWALTQRTDAGSTVGEQLPLVAQGLVQWKTTHVTSGRMLRGRTFVPGLLEGVSTTGGVPSAAMVTLLGTAGSALIANASCELIIWSKAHGETSPVVTAAGWSQWAALRSRRN